MTLTLLAPPPAEPVSLADAKAHLRVTFDAEDALIARLIVAARERIEAELGLSLVETAWRELRDPWPRGCRPQEPGCALTLSRGPLIAVDAAEQAVVGGATAPVAFTAEPGSRPGRVRLAAPAWSGVLAGGVRIDYRAGFGPAAADVPETLRQAVLALVAEAFERRGEAGPTALGLAEPWLKPWRRLRL